MAANFTGILSYLNRNNRENADIDDNIEEIYCTSSADISVIKAADIDIIRTGETITYTVTITNLGPDDGENVTLFDKIPSGIVNPEYSINGGTIWYPLSGPYEIGTLPVGGTETILIRGTYDGSSTGAIFNTANVTTSSFDPNLNNNTSTVVTATEALADLAIYKSAEPIPAESGQPIIYKINIINYGPDTARNVVVRDELNDSHLTPEYSLDGGVNWNPWEGKYDIDNLAPGEEILLLIRAIVYSYEENTLINTASITSCTPDTNPDNNSSTIEVPIIKQADLSIEKYGNPKPAELGEYLTYTIIITNNGPSDAQDIVLTDNIPNELFNVEYSINNGMSWMPWYNEYYIGTLPSGSAIKILIRGIVSSSASGIIINTAEVSSSTPDPDPYNNTSTDETPIAESSDLFVTKIADLSSVQKGDVLTYTIIVSTFGPSDAQDVILYDNISSFLINPEYSTDDGITWESWTGSIALGTVIIDENRKILIRGTVNFEDSDIPEAIENTAYAESPTPDPNPDNNNDTVLTPVKVNADLSITKSAFLYNCMCCRYVIYTITVTNNGPGEAEQIVIKDYITNTLSDVRYSLDNGCNWMPWNNELNIDSLHAGDSFILHIKGLLTSCSIDEIENTSEVSAETPDPNPNNNTVTIKTAVNCLSCDYCNNSVN